MAKVVVVGVETNISDWIEKYIPKEQLMLVSTEEAFNGAIDGQLNEEISAVICGTEFSEISANEIAQSLRMLNGSLEIYFVSSKQEKFDTTQLGKDGIKTCFLFPLDEDRMAEELVRIRSKTTGERLFQTVCFADLAPGETLDFDIFLYMPANKKYLKLVKKENSLSSSQYQRMTVNNRQKAHVLLSDVSKFYDFTAKHLLSVNSDSKISETEKREQLKKSVRVLLTDLFSASEDLATLSGRRSTMANAKQIVRKFIEKSGQVDIKNAINAQVGEQNNGDAHLTNLSVYASLFSLALGIGEPGNMAIAGLVHDLGKDLLPTQIKHKFPENMTSSELLEYEKHPHESVQALKRLNVPLTDDIIKAVSQHHERIDGSGFPMKLSGRYISGEGQILGIADQFDHLTSTVEGRRTFSPLEALERIEQTGKFDGGYIKDLKDLFIDKEENSEGSQDIQQTAATHKEVIDVESSKKEPKAS
ncbi:MAG: HD domain-containing protein [Bdellovibrionaceae bacterium]|nr:HD domain-containing protein [Pseudobdellovibrionaceae bacterium]